MKNCEWCDKNEATLHIEVRSLQTPIHPKDAYQYMKNSRPLYGEAIIKINLCESCLPFKKVTVKEKAQR